LEKDSNVILQRQRIQVEDSSLLINKLTATSRCKPRTTTLHGFLRISDHISLP
jgi:hypothetical protein